MSSSVKDGTDGSHVAIFPYPYDKSPLIRNSSALDPDWILAAKSNNIFAKQVPLPPDETTRSKHVRLSEEQEAFLNDQEVQLKLEHLQVHFWSALDCTRRIEHAAEDVFLLQDDPETGGTLRIRVRPDTKWRYSDLRGMVNWYRFCFCGVLPDQIESEPEDGMWYLTMQTSPWFNRPEFRDCIGWKEFDFKRISPKGGVTQSEKPVNHCPQEEFVRYWWSLVRSLHINRFPDASLVMPYNYETYVRQYVAKK